jgi:hypothetical protein
MYDYFGVGYHATDVENVALTSFSVHDGDGMDLLTLALL